MLFGEQGIRNGKAVIPAEVALHVHGLRHVAIHTVTARLTHRVMTVLTGIDLGSRDGLPEPGRGVSLVTRQTQGVASSLGLSKATRFINALDVGYLNNYEKRESFDYFDVWACKRPT